MKTVVKNKSELINAFAECGGDIVFEGHLAETYRIRYRKAVSLSGFASKLISTYDNYGCIRDLLLYTKGVRLDMFVLELMLGKDIAGLAFRNRYVRMKYLIGGNVVFMKSNH